ncbi:hypothetical protein ACH40E_03145 [Streptomyces acidicola]|uniref:hypothetical protein n=1 Tax=Streptomyces acidicola TaxID=2596892 RepID=UPI0037885A9E
MNARRQIIAALSEDSMGGIATLHDVTDAAKLVDAFAAELLLGAAESAEVIHRNCHRDRDVCAGCQVRADILDVLRSVADVIGEQTSHTADTAPPLTVFRASHDSIVMGLYTTADEARKHCETVLRREWPNSLLDWIEDEEDGVAELVAETADGETETGYVVTALEVASRYDEEADE